LIGVSLQKHADDLMLVAQAICHYRSILRCFQPTAGTRESHNECFSDVVEMAGEWFQQFARRRPFAELCGRSVG
jgi:hypothetical protein